MNNPDPGTFPADRPVRQRSVRDCALSLLERCDRTAAEMRRKLREREYSLEDIEKTMEFLEEYRLIDDGEYARRYIRTHSGRKSVRRLRLDLEQKGVGRELIDEAMEDCPVDEDAQIAFWIRKKGYVPGDTLDRDQYRKLTASLARRGYSYESIRRALCQLCE